MGAPFSEVKMLNMNIKLLFGCESSAILGLE